MDDDFCLEFLAGSELVLFLKNFQKSLSPILQSHSLTAKAFKFYMDIFVWEDMGKITRGIVAFFLNVDDDGLLKH